MMQRQSAVIAARLSQLRLARGLADLAATEAETPCGQVAARATVTHLDRMIAAGRVARDAAMAAELRPSARIS